MRKNHIDAIKGSDNGFMSRNNKFMTCEAGSTSVVNDNVIKSPKDNKNFDKYVS